MKKNRLPDERLDIITPMLPSQHLPLKQAETSPDLQQLRQQAQNNIPSTTLSLITPKTSLAARKATEILGYYFKREFRSDFPPYQAQEDTNDRDRIFLLTQSQDWETYAAIGAIGFRWRTSTHAPAGLALAWIWLHPFRRRQGILSSYWNAFRTAYGTFPVEAPVSKAMRAFLAQYPDHTLL
jgi:hypothetical protein